MGCGLASFSVWVYA